MESFDGREDEKLSKSKLEKLKIDFQEATASLENLESPGRSSRKKFKTVRNPGDTSLMNLLNTYQTNASAFETSRNSFNKSNNSLKMPDLARQTKHLLNPQSFIGPGTVGS